MTPRTSVRAAARECYGELKMRAVDEPAPPSLTLPLSGGGDTAAVQGEGEQTDLTARIRALYEDTSVPVREIAAIAGVTERTLYKYVEKHGWKKRYAVLPRGEAAAAGNRGRRWAHRQGLAPAKGAGGRFIRREDIGKPFATGLKALDAQGRAQALARCDEAEPAARAAQAEAEGDALTQAFVRALAHLHHAGGELRRYRAECKRARAYRAAVKIARYNPSYKVPKEPAPRFAESPLRERALKLAERVAFARVEAVLARQERALAGANKNTPPRPASS